MTQAGKPLYLVGNWKSNKTHEEAEEFFSILSLPVLAPNLRVVICPPMPYLYSIADLVKQTGINVSLGVQDLSPYPLGAYTGAVSSIMIKQVAHYAIIGHSERRKYFQESNEEVAKKTRMALEDEITPIVCVDEPYLETQLAHFTLEEMQRIIFAYEPVSAIGSGIPDTPEHAQEIALTIQRLAQTNVPVLYGGSVTEKSVSSFITMPAINGVLVGGASLNPDQWSSLVTAAIS